jgi:hypothetical protein
MGVFEDGHYRPPPPEQASGRTVFVKILALAAACLLIGALFALAAAMQAGALK